MAVKRAFATAGLTSVETAVVKATFDDDEKPKIKHVRTICDYVELELAGMGYNTSSSNKENLVEMFRKRAQEHSWRIVLKSLITLHTLFRECDVAFTEEFSHFGEKRVFTLTKIFYDNSSSSSTVHSTFIRKYSKYLSEKLSVFKALKFNVERKLGQNNKDFFKQYNVQTLGSILPKIMTQLARILEIMPQLDSSTFVIHPLSRESMLLLIKDSLRIYSSIQLCLWELLCSFQKLNLEQAKWVSRVYKRYFQLNERYKEWFQRVVRFGIVNHQYAPKFNTLPQTLADKLNKYISNQEKAKKRKKKNKRKNKHNDDSESDDSNDDDDDNDNNQAKYDNHEVGNLEDILEKEDLENFSESATKYKQQKKEARAINKPKTSNKSRKNKKIKNNVNNNNNNNNRNNNNNNNEQKETDLLGFGDILTSNTSNIVQSTDDNKANDDFFNSLNIKTPEAVNADQFQWSNWGSLDDDKNGFNETVNNNNNNNTNNTNNNKINATTNFMDNMDNMNNSNNNNNLDDWWSSVPTTNTNTNDNFGSFVNNTNNNTNNNVNLGLGGAPARKLKKNQPENNDPFMDLLNFN